MGYIYHTSTHTSKSIIILKNIIVRGLSLTSSCLLSAQHVILISLKQLFFKQLQTHSGSTLACNREIWASLSLTLHPECLFLYYVNCAEGLIIAWSVPETLICFMHIWEWDYRYLTDVNWGQCHYTDPHMIVLWEDFQSALIYTLPSVLNQLLFKE